MLHCHMFHLRHDDGMRILLLLIFILTPLGHAVAVTRADSLYNCIDEAIANSSKYIAKRESYIRHIRNMYAAAANPSARYSIALELYREYRAFMSDSALAWLDRAETIARVREPLPCACSLSVFFHRYVHRSGGYTCRCGQDEVRQAGTCRLLHGLQSSLRRAGLLQQG